MIISILKFFFYFIGLMAIIYELWAIENYKTLEVLREKLKKDKMKAKISDQEQTFGCLHMLYMMWVFVGLFSSQWICFLGIVLMSMFGVSLKGKSWNFIDSVITICLILFAILNTYHWHIDLGHLLLNYFKS